MNAIDRSIVLRNLRKIAIGDSAYILRAYMAGHAAEIGEALNVNIRMWLYTTGDSDLKNFTLQLIDEAA